jgi:DnaJ-class molecular chaperone
MKLKEGEYICDKCNGRGSLPTRNPDVVTKCPKCNGKKKLDWIENIVGVTKNKPKETDVIDQWTKVVAEQMAEKLDKDLIKTILSGQSTDEKDKLPVQRIIIEHFQDRIKWNIS